MSHGKLSGDVASQGVAHDMRTVDVQVVEETKDVQDHLFAILVGVIRLSAPTVPPAVEGDHSIARPSECLHDTGRLPMTGVGARKSMNEQDGFALPLIDIVDLDAVRIKELSRGLGVRDRRKNKNENEDRQQTSAPR